MLFSPPYHPKSAPARPVSTEFPPGTAVSAFSLTVACWRVAAWEGGGEGRDRFVHEKHSKSIGK